MKLKDLAYRTVPGIEWLNRYTLKDWVADVIAGVTVALTVLPQGLAYATLAGLEPQYGLYSAFMGGIVYAFFGSCPQVTIGPTALLALITSHHTGFGLTSGADYAILLCLISGIVEFLMAILRLGALVDLISLPVTVGFTSATAVIIGTSQLKGLFGLRSDSGSGFLNTITSVFSNLDKMRMADFSLGFVAIIILLFLRKLKDFKFSNKRKLLKSISWILVTGRNALVVLISSIIAYYSCKNKASCPFILTGNVKSGLPGFQVPKFETNIVSANGTVVHQNYRDMIWELRTSMIILPIIAVLGNVAISKAFGTSGLSATREMFALSLSNICGSFFCSMPVTGSFSRSAVNHASGVRTPFGGLYTSAFVLLAVAVLTPYFQFIPKAALSAVIVSAVIFMIEFEVVKPLWRCSRRELLPGAVTFVMSLALGVEVGIPLGVATDVAFLIYRAARPVIATKNGITYIVIRPKQSSLCFPSIDWVRCRISNALSIYGSVPVVLDFSTVNDFDFTAARGIGILHKELLNVNVNLILMKVSNEMIVILKEATNIEFHLIDDLDELESTLDQTSECEPYLRVTVPLINGQTLIDCKEIDHGKSN
uniref:STAS domain-containing protein n=1 Tax=Glossina palpalis gambiensis TaxID=67801 RepID=A0A1B0C4U1_9MUSC